MTCPVCHRIATRAAPHGTGHCQSGGDCHRCGAELPAAFRVGRPTKYCSPACRYESAKAISRAWWKAWRDRGCPTIRGNVIDQLTDDEFKAAHAATPNVLALRAFLGGNTYAIRRRARDLGIARQRGGRHVQT